MLFIKFTTSSENIYDKITFQSFRMLHFRANADHGAAYDSFNKNMHIG